MTPTVSFGNRYTFSIENKFILIEFLPWVNQFGDQDKVFCMNRYLSHLIRRKLCELWCIMKFNWCMHLEYQHLNSFVYSFLLPNDYDVEIWYLSAFFL